MGGGNSKKYLDAKTPSPRQSTTSARGASGAGNSGSDERSPRGSDCSGPSSATAGVCSEQQMQMMDAKAAHRAELGQFESALKLYQKSLRQREEFYNKDHPAVALTLVDVGDVYLRLERLNDAIQEYSRALKIQDHEAFTEGYLPPEEKDIDGLTVVEHLTTINNMAFAVYSKALVHKKGSDKYHKGLVEASQHYQRIVSLSQKKIRRRTLS